MNYVIWLAIFSGVFFLFYRYATREKRLRKAVLAVEFPGLWRQILTERVAFYLSLTKDDKLRFEKLVQLFLAQTRITGIETEVDDVTRVLVASAIIPTFGFPDWEYGNLGEVLIVPDAWKQTNDPNREVAPLQGTLLGSVQGFQNQHYMRLSKASLEHGFRDTLDKQNVGIHEFAHLLDQADGTIDGVPQLALPPELRQAWAGVVQREIEAIRAGKSDINTYGGTNEAEFFAVVIEYFFEKPEKLQESHPELYQLLTRILRQNPKKRYLRFSIDPRNWIRSLRTRRQLGRNDPCPCGSGKKYKDCHLKKAPAVQAT